MSAESRVAEPELNATPLIDVLLVLLVMLIMTVPIATHAVKLNLPHGAPGVPAPDVHLDILYRGDIYWDGEFVASLRELETKLRELTARENPPLLKVVPERRASYDRVAQVLAAAQRARVEKLSVMPVPDP
jgi:biopolymer transport protein ExbD